ncbi:hypothetical protein [Dyadobacter tibetensis]|uniref:hypothetical protein n=1 Tax=Dyadobacter tibetensis TaxID=1211851 RepID=UPI0004B71227|nr:hypothetical protein [Dyadobacter tibetensis]
MEKIFKRTRKEVTASNVIPVGIIYMDALLLSEAQVEENIKVKSEGKKADASKYENIELITAGPLQDEVFQGDVQFQRDEVLDDGELRSVQSYPELNPDSYWIYNIRQILRNICFSNDTIKHKWLSVNELRQLPFQTMPDSALRINFVNP